MKTHDVQYKLEGKIALVTGASSGLGKSFAKTLARANTKVIITGRRLGLLQQLATEIQEFNKDVLALELDLCDKDSINTVIEKTNQHFGAINILVNNAGITVEKESFLHHTLEDWQKVIDTNLTGTWLMTQSVAKQMIEHNVRGSIINISSIAGTRAHIQSSPGYAVSKAGINHLTRALSCELAQWGIRINTIAPGGIITEESTWQDEDFAKRLAAKIPLKRFGKLNELNGALLFLASDLSSYTTGSLLQIDGGLAANQL
jgi:NAD(P)-dependent dehydrogenase (short-subunit alcohol dehydrogenase family)